ncbi:aldehyde dehydrogenase [Chitinophaga tropicalis]|uniref:Aldehyde dehydrogenase n=1 Tax=Chitinophaga tropicalis TaxID=2683588 RepID=A0A7K1TXP8_9BACT|nr:aldehyde dehydrogenase [Chitinophaga tropicalis]MVT06856.1 aldehyde dehydrogenase family protein [Chitinophaga tropicalis]
MSIENIYKAQQSYFASGKTLPYEFRKQQLKALRRAVKKYEKEILTALQLDLHKHPAEAFASEPGLIYTEISYLQQNLKRWMRPQAVSSPFLQYPSKSRIYRVPLGLTLIIAPWNYPFQLLMSPLAGAIAGGNCAVLKPSEMTPHTSAITEKLIKETFDPAYITVIQGEGHVVIPEAMQYRFDHVFFTGSPGVGRKIMEMAARHLTPVTLELGGKSPCIVDDKVNIKVAARRIVWGKYWNAGQTCVAPDYILVHSKVKEELVAAMRKAVVKFFGKEPAASKDYGRIISGERFRTLNNYLEQGNVLHGGQINEQERYMAPTLMDGVDWDSPVMQEEIFGPVLPVLTFNKLEEALEMINRQPAPLSVYVFTERAATEEAVQKKLRFGGGCINNTLVHFTNPEMPFGGVGYSGMGQYHGKYSFETFTHPRGMMKSGTWVDTRTKYPPFGRLLSLLRMMMR